MLSTILRIESLPYIHHVNEKYLAACSDNMIWITETGLPMYFHIHKSEIHNAHVLYMLGSRKHYILHTEHQVSLCKECICMTPIIDRDGEKNS